MAGIANVLLVQYAGGFTQVHDQDSVDEYGRKEGFLKLGGIQLKEVAEELATATLAQTAWPRETTTMSIEPTGTGDAPFVDFNVGDYVTAPDSDGSDGSQRVMSLTVVEDDNGEITVAPELKARWEMLEERLQTALKRLSNGTLGGSSNSPQPVVQRPDNGKGGLTPEWIVNELRQRIENGISSDDDPTPGTGTFDQDTDQLIEKMWYVSTSTNGSGVVDFTIPDGGFATGILAVDHSLAQPVNEAVVLIWDVAASSRTTVRLLAVRLNGLTYNSQQIGVVLKVNGW